MKKLLTFLTILLTSANCFAAYNMPVSASLVTGLSSIATTGNFSDLTGTPTTLSGYGITDAYPLSGNPSGFLNSLPNIYPQWQKITKTFSNFSVASLTSTITITTLPAKSVVNAVVINPTTAFTGGLIAGYTVSVGMQTNVDLAPASSMFTTVTNPFSYSLIAAGDINTTEDITATATSLTGLLNAATQGSVDIYLLVSTLP